MMGTTIFKAASAVATGAATGAIFRWYLSEKLNSLFPAIPPGTLVANLIGAYIIGICIAIFSSADNLSPEWRLLIVTGFCGGLTTFSTFSAETAVLLQHGRIMMAFGSISLHVIGSLVMTFAGMGSVYLFR